MSLQIFTAHKSENLEDFRAQKQGELQLTVFTLILGVATVLFALLGVPRILPEEGHQSFYMGFYSGVGCCVAVISLIGIVNLRRLLRDDAALKRERTKAMDERNQQINHYALQAAGFCLSFLLYAGVLVVGLFNPTLFWFCFAAAMCYSVLTVVFRAYFTHKL